MKSQWSDLPRRLATVSIGAPAIVIILSHRQTSIIFFQAVHILCTLEWVRLRPTNSNSTADTPLHETTESRSSSVSNTANDGCKAGTPPWTSTLLFPAVSLLLATSSTSRFPAYLSLAAALLYLSYYVDVDSYTCHDKSNDDDNNTTTTRTATRESIRTECQHCLHGLLYLTPSFHSWLQLSYLSFTHTVYLLFIVWNSDTGALLGGRIGKALFRTTDDVVGKVLLGRFRWGRRLVRLVNTISPKKSFTGFLGGVVLGMGTALSLPRVILAMHGWMDAHRLGSMGGLVTTIVEVLEVVFGRNGRGYVDVSRITTGLLDFEHLVPSSTAMVSSSSYLGEAISYVAGTVWIRRCILGLVLSTFGIVGDMVESAVKRSSGKKDSGKLLPGHGGLLDRFDSTFFAVAVYVHLCMER